MGSDSTHPYGRHPRRRFNSRSRVGSDSFAGATMAKGEVSIHAPAWGATGDGGVGLRGGGFNSRSRVGSDTRGWRGRRPLTSFNSRSRVGSDLEQMMTFPTPSCFNSRSRVGSDVVHVFLVQCRDSFNSRSRVGSDCQSLRPFRTCRFQFTLPRGERQRRGHRHRPRRVSIHAPAWGATRCRR